MEQVQFIGFIIKVCLGYPNRLQVAAMPILETEVCRNASKVYSAVSRTAFCAGYLRLVGRRCSFSLVDLVGASIRVKEIRVTKSRYSHLTIQVALFPVNTTVSII